MLGLTWTQIAIIGVVAVFLLGPDRIPAALRYATTNLTKARAAITGAQNQLQQQFEPELAELRRQVAELQSLKELANLEQFYPQRISSGIAPNPLRHEEPNPASLAPEHQAPSSTT